MADEKYAKAYKEVLKILENVPEDDVAKIPNEMIETFRKNQDEQYIFEIDLEKPFEEQKLMEETQAILANIFRDYWATPYQKERILAKEKFDKEKEEKEKQQKYNPDNIFKNKKETKQVQNNLPVEVKKQKFFDKLIGFIKKIFKHKNENN